MKRFSCVLLSLLMMLSLVACSNNSSNTQAEDDSTTKPNNEDNANDADIQGLEVDEKLFDVKVTIPADFLEDATQEDLNESVAGNEGIKSVVLNADGSATYTMTKDAHAEMLKELKGEIDAGLEEIVADTDYTFTKIEHNDDYTKFTVTTDATELNLNDSFAALAFYMFGGMYGAFSGSTPDNIQVDFVNASTGEVISSSNSKDME